MWWLFMKTKMKATFDRKFGAGDKITDQLDLSKVRRAGTEAKRGSPDVDRAIHRPRSAAPRRDASVAHQAGGSPNAWENTRRRATSRAGTSGHGWFALPEPATPPSKWAGPGIIRGDVIRCYKQPDGNADERLPRVD